MKNKLIALRYAAMALCCAAVLVSCGGSSKESGANNISQEGGLAPALVEGDIRLTPLDANVHGTILLTDTPARVAYFNPPSTAATTTGAYTGNYTYTKCGPDMVELKMDNVRELPIQTARDAHWTIIGYLTFVEGGKVVFTGTETLVGSHGPVHNDPMGFDGDPDGGTRNFSLNYTFTMGN